MGAEEIGPYGASIVAIFICDLKFIILGFVNTGTCTSKQCDGTYFTADLDVGTVLVYANGRRC